MKKNLFILTILISLASCRKKDNPPLAMVKLIDKIEIAAEVPTGFGGTTIKNTKLVFTYNANKEVAMLEHYTNNTLDFKFSPTYANGVPNKIIVETGGDAAEVTPQFQNNILKSLQRTGAFPPVAVNYDATAKQYHVPDLSLYVGVDENNSITSQNNFRFVVGVTSHDDLQYYHDNSKKGPLFNLPNAGFLPVLTHVMAYGTDKFSLFSKHPVSRIDSGNNPGQDYSFTNVYDADGFVISSQFDFYDHYDVNVTYTYKTL